MDAWPLSVNEICELHATLGRDILSQLQIEAAPPRIYQVTPTNP